MTPEQAVKQLKLSKPPPEGTECFQTLEDLWENEQLSSIKTFCAEQDQSVKLKVFIEQVHRD